MAIQRIGITGGIGSGKSTLCRMLEKRGMDVFYCDEVARQLMSTDAELICKIRELVGDNDKQAIRSFLAKGPDSATRLNALVWPRVRSAWQTFCRKHAEEGAECIVMECALLFESGFDADTDTSILITMPAELRVTRVAARDGISQQQIADIMTLQLSDAEKTARASYTLNNDSTPEVLLNKFDALWKHA